MVVFRVVCMIQNTYRRAYPIAHQVSDHMMLARLHMASVCILSDFGLIIYSIFPSLAGNFSKSF